MSNVNSLSKHLSIQSEEQKSWVGSYQEAETRRFRHLTDECCICGDKYLPDQQVIVLPCFHGLHKECFAPMQKKVCPMDYTSEEALKVSLLGRSLLLPPETKFLNRLFNVELETLEKKLSQSPAKKEELEKLLSDENEKMKLGELLDGVWPILQDCVDVYSSEAVDGGRPIQARERYERLSAYLQQNKGWEKWLSIFEELFDESAPDAVVKFHRDFDAIQERGRERLLVLQIILPALVAYQGDHFRGVERVLDYLYEVSKLAVRNPDFRKYAIESAQVSDRRFYIKHLQALRTLDSQVSKYRYLYSLSPQDRERLEKVTKNAKGPLSGFIQQGTPRVKTAHKVVENVVSALILVSLAAFLYSFMDDQVGSNG